MDRRCAAAAHEAGVAPGAGAAMNAYLEGINERFLPRRSFVALHEV